MADFTLNAQERTITGKKVRQLRNQGLVPINVYGAKTDAMSLKVPYRELEVTLLKAGGTNLIELNVSGKTWNVLAREVQRDVIKGTIKHVDFVAVDADARVVIDVPIYIVGESAAVAARKAILLTGPNSLSIEMQATDMIDKIEVDLTNYPELGDSLHVRDLDLGHRSRILNDPDEMIIRIAQSSAARRDEALLAAAESEEGEGEGMSEEEEEAE